MKKIESVHAEELPKICGGLDAVSVHFLTRMFGPMQWSIADGIRAGLGK